jgi:predicted DNA-binding transcriptional regulator AlpA
MALQSPQQSKARRIVRPREFSDRLFGPGKSLSSLYDHIAKGHVEPGKKILGSTSVGWDSDYVDTVIEKILGPSPDSWQSLGEAAARVVNKVSG